MRGVSYVPPSIHFLMYQVRFYLILSARIVNLLAQLVQYSTVWLAVHFIRDLTLFIATAVFDANSKRLDRPIAIS